MKHEINVEQISNIADKSDKIGDECLKVYETDKKLEYAKTAITAFRNALYANGLLIKAKKL